MHKAEYQLHLLTELLLVFRNGDCLFSTSVILQAVVLDDELDPDLVADIRLYIERLLDEGLRARLIALIKVWMLVIAA